MIFELLKSEWAESIDIHTTVDQYSFGRFVHEKYEKEISALRSKMAEADGLLERAHWNIQEGAAWHIDYEKYLEQREVKSDE